MCAKLMSECANTSVTRPWVSITFQQLLLVHRVDDQNDSLGEALISGMVPGKRDLLPIAEEYGGH